MNDRAPTCTPNIAGFCRIFFSIFALLGLPLAAPAIELPPGFVAVPLPGTLDIPVGFTFANDGTIFIIQKAGAVLVHDGNALQTAPFVDLSAEVNDDRDRGLLGIALHPGFVPDGGATSWVYLLYTVTPVIGEDFSYNQDDRYSFSRLTRYRAATLGTNIRALPGSRQILLGHKAGSGVVADGIASCHDSHATGSLEFADDGSLMVANGDGAHYNFQDNGGADTACFAGFIHPVTGRRGPMLPYEDSGSFRSQDIRSLAGKILRIDPETGNGYDSNPFFDGDVTTNASKVWAMGLRNPYRMGLKPATGLDDPALGQPNIVYIGDVGWNTWEETNVAIAGGENFGWPCFEGFGPHLGYQSFQRGNDPLQRPDCGDIPPQNHVRPMLSWHHSNNLLLRPPGAHVDEDGNPQNGFNGRSSTGGAFYEGGSYPGIYAGRYFFGDYIQSWIRTIEVTGHDQMVAVRDFAVNADGPSDFQRHPVNGDIYYMALNSFSLRRIQFIGE